MTTDLSNAFAEERLALRRLYDEARLAYAAGDVDEWIQLSSRVAAFELCIAIDTEILQELLVSSDCQFKDHEFTIESQPRTEPNFATSLF